MDIGVGIGGVAYETVASGGGAGQAQLQARGDWTSREQLAVLWAQSAQLRANALAARMAAMEARAIARSLRMQRPRSEA